MKTEFNKIDFNKQMKYVIKLMEMAREQERNKILTMINKSINKTDNRILSLLDKSESLSVGEITRSLKIAPVNVWKRLKKLELENLIIVPKVKRGKVKLIKLSSEGKEILKFIKLNKHNKT